MHRFSIENDKKVNFKGADSCPQKCGILPRIRGNIPQVVKVSLNENAEQRTSYTQLLFRVCKSSDITCLLNWRQKNVFKIFSLHSKIRNSC